MDTLREDNPFEDEKISQEWIRSVENEKGLIRDSEIYPALQEWIRETKPEIVVEIGSGQGICSEKIQSPKSYYIGVEPSVFLTERAKELYGSDKREFLTGSAYSLPVSNNATDSVFSVNVWFHLADLTTASREMARILKKGGDFLIITANPSLDNFWEKSFVSYTKNGKAIDGKVKVPVNPLSRNIIYQHSLKEISLALEKNGLVIEEVKTLGKLEEGDIFIRIQGRKS